MKVGLKMAITDDFKYCERIIKKNSKSFYYAFNELPPKKARAVFAIYTFCRFADDSIDVYQSSDKLAQLKSELEAFDQGAPPNTPLWRALRVVFDEFEMDIKPFYEMIIGQEQDIVFENITTLDALAKYSYYVASTVGLMLLPIVATLHHKKLTQIACDIGYAMQLTNILRDVGEDYRIGRVYLPSQLLLMENCDLSLQSVTPQFIAVWEQLATIAQDHYDLAIASYDLFDADSIFPLKLSVSFYRELLEVVRANGYDCFTKRAMVSQSSKLKLMLAAKK